MGRLQPLFTVVILAAVCLAVDGTLALASDEDSIQRVLAAGQQAMQERHFRQALHVLQNGLRNYPQDSRLRLELGRAYLSNREDGRAIRLFREILRLELEQVEYIVAKSITRTGAVSLADRPTSRSK